MWRLGGIAICPHANTRFFQGALPDAVWLVGDLELLRRCDAVIVTGQWHRSEGTRAEINFANDLKIPVFFQLIALDDWLHRVRVDSVEAARR